MSATDRSSHLKPTATTTSDRNVKHVVLGDLLFPTWYQSLYPEDLVSKETGRLYVCRWCFRYSCDVNIHARHTKTCPHRITPPGTKVYDHGGYSVWEVDGADHKLFAQNLSLFAKLFLDHKSVFFDVASFLYYLLAFTDPDDEEGNYYILGFYSKEKLSWDANNLACILIFPPYQHKQLGKLLMGVSYKLSAWERDGSLIGGPEKPLSEMGRRSYGRFWEERIARYLVLLASSDAEVTEEKQQQQQSKPSNSKGSRKRHPHELMTVQEIGLATGMLTEDVIAALRGLGVIEPTTPSKTRKGTQSSADGEGETVVIRKSNVLEWVKTHSLNLRDPVREEGFLVRPWETDDIHEGSSLGSEDIGD